MKARYILLASAALVGAGVWGMRQNAQKSSSMTAAIVAADKAGTDTAALRSGLQAYASTHMNAQTSFELTVSLERDQALAQAAAVGAQAQGAVYAAGQAACASKANSIVLAHCVTAYVQAHSTPGTQPQPAAMPVRSNYQYSYQSPVWVADPTGLVLVGALALLISAPVAYWSHRRHEATA